MNICVTSPAHVPEEMFVTVPGGIANAAFWMGLAAATPGLRLHVRNVPLEPEKLAFVDMMIRMGVRVREEVEVHDAGRTCGHLDIRGAKLKGVVVPADMTLRLLEELPVLSVLAAVAKGWTTFGGAMSLPPAPLNRLRLLCDNLRALNVRVEEQADGFSVEGGCPLQAAEFDTLGDHGMTMGLALAGLLAQGVTTLRGAECVERVYPGFFADGPSGSFTQEETG